VHPLAVHTNLATHKLDSTELKEENAPTITGHPPTAHPKNHAQYESWVILINCFTRLILSYYTSSQHS